jgi:hypothetical protein
MSRFLSNRFVLKFAFSFILAFCPVFLAPLSAHAQTFQSYISGIGDDINPCVRTAPCRTLAGALSKTASGGIVNVLDSGGYGAALIKRPVTVLASGVNAVVTSASGGITIDVGSGDVHLRGLTLVGQGNSNNGVTIVSATSVHISNTVIRGYAGAGIGLASKAPVALTVSDSEVNSNTTGVSATTDDAEIVLDRVKLTSNQTAVSSGGNNSVFHLDGCTVAFNAIAVGKVGGKILSGQNNAMVANKSDGQPMTKEPLQ